MPSEKRMRQRQGREARRQQLLAAQRKRKAIRRGVAIGVIVLFIAGIVGLATLNNRDDETDVTSGASTTAGKSTTTEARPVKVGTQECPKADGSSPKTTKFDGSFKQCIDPTKTYTAKITTDVGDVTVELDQKKAPNTVNNFVSLARYHAYDDVPFHRVIPDFVVQGGDVALKNGGGDAGYKFNDELPEPGDYKAGSVAMANGGPNTNGSQFFILTSDAGAKELVQASQGKANYNLFGQVTGGMDVVKKIEADGNPAPQANGSPPKVTHKVTSVTITEA